MGGIYYRPVYLPAVYQDHVPGSQWIRTAFHHIGHISGKKNHDFEEIMVVEVVSP